MVYRNRVVRPRAGLFFLLSFVLVLSSCSSGTETAPDCDPHVGPCTQQAGKYGVTLDISPKPVRHMEELTFDVIFSDDSPLLSPEPLVLDLSMPGMDMGKNRVKLEKTGENRYSGTGIIVKCPSGKTLWRATVFLPDNLQAAFTFHVRD